MLVSDITERKRWNDEVKRQEMLLRLVIDALPGMVFIWIVTSDIVSPIARPVNGSRALHQISRAGSQRRYRRDWVRSGAGAVHRALGGEEVEVESTYPYADRERDVHVNYVPDRGPDGEIRGMVALVQDVTEQKRAERALRDSEERFRRIVEIAAEGIWIVDMEGNTEFVNDRMAAVLGYSKEEMLGRLCFDFVDPEEYERARREFRFRKEDARLGPQEYRFRHRDGSIVWLDITGSVDVR